MFTLRTPAVMFSALMMLSNVAFGQAYPTKPVRIVTGAPGSSNDLVLRLISQYLTETWKQSVVVENQASGVNGTEIVSKALPDGYTLLLSPPQLWITPLLQKTPYDLNKDLTPVTLTSRTPNILFVIPSIPANSVKEFIVVAKSKPGELNYASGATGSTSHLAGELFNSLAGVKLVRIGYKGGAQQIADLLAAQVQLTFSSLSGMEDYIKTGKLKALGVASATPSPLAPNLPTIASTLPGFESVILHAMYAPAGTSSTVVNQIAQEVVRFLKTPEGRNKILALAVEAVGTTPGELDALVKADTVRWAKVIKDGNIRVD